MAGNSYSYGDGNSDGWVIKTDLNGSLLWNKVFTDSEDVIFNYVDTGIDNNYIMTGYKTSVSNNNNNAIAACISQGGDSLWYYAYEDTLNMQAKAVHSSGDSIYVIGGKIFVDSAQTNTFFLKVDTSGHPISLNSSVLANQGFNDLYDFIELRNHNFMILESTTSSGAGGIDVLQEFTDPNGNYIPIPSSPTHGGPGTDVAYSISQTGDGGFVMGGSTNSWRPGLQAVYLIKTDSAGITIPVGVHELKSDFTKLSIYPDPCLDYTYIGISKKDSYTNAKLVSLNIFNVLGENVYSEKVLPDQIIKINTSSFPSGVYFVQLKSSGNITGTGKLIVK